MNPIGGPSKSEPPPKRQYFVKGKSGIGGPFTKQQLVELVAARKLKPDHLISTDNEHWVKARSIKLLFPKSAQSSSCDPSSTSRKDSRPMADQSKSAEPATQWFVKLPGAEGKAYALDQLRALKEIGMLTATTPVSRDGKAWMTASRILELGLSDTVAPDTLAKAERDIAANERRQKPGIPARGGPPVSKNRSLLVGFLLDNCARFVLWPLCAMFVFGLLGFSLGSLFGVDWAITAGIGFALGIAAAGADLARSSGALMNDLSEELLEDFSQKQKSALGYAALLVGLAAIAFVIANYEYKTYHSGRESTPLTVPLSSIETESFPDNAFVSLQDAHPVGTPVRAQTIYYVALSSDENISSFETVRLIAKITNDDVVSIDKWEGVIVDNVDLLLDHRNDLETMYPGIQLDRCRPIWVGSRPPSIMKLVGICAFGVLSLALAVLLVAWFALQVRRAAKETQ